MSQEKFDSQLYSSELFDRIDELAVDGEGNGWRFLLAACRNEINRLMDLNSAQSYEIEELETRVNELACEVNWASGEMKYPPMQREIMGDSEWFGDKSDGIELRYQGEGGDRFLDEIVVYRDGECCVHIESMSEQHYWMSLQSKRFEVHANCLSKNGRSHVELRAEGWKKESD